MLFHSGQVSIVGIIANFYAYCIKIRRRLTSPQPSLQAWFTNSPIKAKTCPAKAWCYKSLLLLPLSAGDEVEVRFFRARQIVSAYRSIKRYLRFVLQKSERPSAIAVWNRPQSITITFASARPSILRLALSE